MSTSAAAKFVGQSSEIAQYYGFRPLIEVVPEWPKVKALTFSDTALACNAKLGVAGDPLLTFYVAAGGKNARESGEFTLQILGCPAPIAEIHLLKTLEAILTEQGTQILSARINCLGDKDSRGRFQREVGNYIRRRSAELEPHLSPVARSKIAENPLHIYELKNEIVEEILREGPRPVHFLSEKSRVHFRLVLEYLEHVGFPYEIDDLLIGDEHEPRVTFRLELSDGTSMLVGCGGGRYDDFFQRTFSKSGASGVRASIVFRTKSGVEGTVGRRFAHPPKIYFIQFGDSAKLTGFSVLESLRRARIPVGQHFDARHLTAQLSSAQATGVTYVLIMGQREAIDGTVIVRTLATSAQTIVPICELPKHLRTLKLV